MERIITVYGKTSPYEITLKSVTHPFAVDEYLVINDSYNNNPLCRVVSSEVTTIEHSKTYLATAKVESIVKYPIDSGAVATQPTFKDIAPFIMSVEPNEGFVMGEVAGTSFNDIPISYRHLVAMCNDGKVEPQQAIPFVFNYKKLYESPHIGLFGGSGSGKTVAMKVFIEELMKRNIPGIVLDPHLEMNFAECKPEIPNEYRVDFNHNFEIFNIGKNNFGIDFSELSTDELVSIMSFSGELSGAMDSLLRTLHYSGMTLYELRKLIDDLVALFNKMEQTYEELSQEEKNLQRTYLSKIPSLNTVIALSWRLNGLVQSNIFDGTISPVIEGIKNGKICVIRGTNQQIHIVASHAMEKLYSLRRTFIDARENHTFIDVEPFPPFFICMDEAHLFCPGTSTFSLTKRIIKTIAQEGRKYGVFELLATQRPALLDSTIVAQIANKFIFRLSIKEYIESIKKETDLNDSEIKKLPYMNSGECYVSSSIVGRTMFVKVRYGITMAKNAMNPFDELTSIKKLSIEEEIILKHIPFNANQSLPVLQEIKKATGKILKLAELTKICDDMAFRGLINVENSFCGTAFLKK